MTKEKLYKLIQLQPEIVKKLEVIGSQIDFDKIDHDLNQILDSDSAKQAYDCLELMLKGDTDHLKMLYCQLECACRIYERYVKKIFQKPFTSIQ